MNSESVTYKGIQSNPTSNIAKLLELQSWIVNPSSRPYSDDKDTRLIARSAGTEIKGKSIVQKQLELQSRIISS